MSVRLLPLVLLLEGAAVPPAAEPAIDRRLASRIFQEVRWASEDDGGKLWGRELYGPLLFADPGSREVVANQADHEGRLKAQGDLWVGTLPPEVGIANTATRWAGVQWTMVMWPLPTPTASRMELVLHECFHRIQAEIGLPAPERPPGNAHLDTQAGRAWLRLEWLALAEALLAQDEAQERAAIEDALHFRAWRRSLFPQAAAEEDRMEIHEGLAEYTGVRRMGLGQLSRHDYVSGRLRTAVLTRPSLPMSFAYESGPAYGLLLDATNQPWRSEVTTSTSLSALLARRHGIALSPATEAAVLARARLYRGDAVLAEEAQREKQRAEREATYRRELVQGPLLELPIPQGNYTFDPNEVFALGAEGVVFPISQISDAWGVLSVENGVRLNPAKDRAFVPAPPDPSARAASGWHLTLHPGWKLAPGARPGDLVVVQEP